VEAKPQHLERFAVRTGNRISFVLADEVDCLHVGKKTPLLRETLNNLEERLDPKKFVCIHRSTIIQVSRIRELQKLPNRDLRLLLVNGVTLKVNRLYRDRLDQWLSSNFWRDVSTRLG
jgi:two-component system LytT family response regulator